MRWPNTGPKWPSPKWGGSVAYRNHGYALRSTVSGYITWTAMCRTRPSACGFNTPVPPTKVPRHLPCGGGARTDPVGGACMNGGPPRGTSPFVGRPALLSCRKAVPADHLVNSCPWRHLFHRAVHSQLHMQLETLCAHWKRWAVTEWVVLVLYGPDAFAISVGTPKMDAPHPVVGVRTREVV